MDVFCPGALLSKQRREDTPKKGGRTRRSHSLAIVKRKEMASSENGKPNRMCQFSSEISRHELHDHSLASTYPIYGVITE